MKDTTPDREVPEFLLSVRAWAEDRVGAELLRETRAGWLNPLQSDEVMNEWAMRGIGREIVGLLMGFGLVRSAGPNLFAWVGSPEEVGDDELLARLEGLHQFLDRAGYITS